MASFDRAFFVIGSGGHGRVVGDLIRAAGHRLAGYVDADPAKVSRTVDSDGTRVVLEQEALFTLLQRQPPEDVGRHRLALGVGDNSQRATLLRRLSAMTLPALIHPSAAVSPGASVGRGAVVFAAAVVNTGAKVGDGVIVNSGAVVEHDCVLEDCVHLSPRAVLSGAVTVGARTWVGAGAVIIQNVVVGADCIVGAGAVVIADVPDGAVVVGNPARPIHRHQRGSAA